MIKLGVAIAPCQRRQILDPVHVEQGWLASVVPILALLDAAGPSTLKVGHDPAARSRGNVQAEIRPREAAPWMLDNASPLANSGQGGFEATSVVALGLALTSPLDVQRLAGP